MKAIIKSIENRIGELEKASYVDENTGQLDDYSPNFPVKFPCVLIDIGNADFSDMRIDRKLTPSARQIATNDIVITISNLKLGNTSYQAPSNQKEIGWSIWDLIEEVHGKIQGWNATNYCGKLIRTRQQRIRRDDGIQQYEITYKADAHNV